MADKDKPATVALDLDKLEREGAPEPFVVRLGGKRFELQDPQELDYRELLKAQESFYRGDPQPSMDILVRESDRNAFFGNGLPNWKLEVLMRQYNEHFGIPSPGEADASSPS